jgi:hypothetical protein
MLMEIAKAGSTTLAMTAQSNTAPYQLKTASWPLGIPGRSRSLLRDFPFEDAAEDFVIHIFGTTYAECLTNYNALIVRLNDAADFVDGLQSVPVLWRVQPLGAAGILVSMILGPVGDKPMVNAAPNILEFENGFWIRDVPVSFMRRPLLIPTAEVSSSQAAAASVGTVQTVSFAAAATTPSPTRLVVPTSANSLVDDIAYGFAILTESNTAAVGANLRTIAASTLSGATDYGTLADSAANRSTSASLLRFTPTVTTRRVSGNPGLSLPYQSALMLAEVRNNTLGKEYVIDVELLSATRWIRGRSEVIDGSTTAARYVVLGVVTTPQIISGIRIGLQAASTGGTLDLDRIFFVEAPKAQLIQHGFVTAPSALAGLNADHRYLTATAPKVNIQETGGPTQAEFWTVDANPLLLTKSQELQVVWQPFPGTSAWSLPFFPSGRYAVRAQAFRYPASLIPQ